MKAWRVSVLAGLGSVFLLAGTGLEAARLFPAEIDFADMSLLELMDIPIRAASGFEQRMAEAPSAVTVVTRRDIQTYGYRTLAEAVSSAAGFYAGYDRMRHYMGVRGFSHNRPGDYNSRTLVLIDGVRVNEPLYGNGMIGGDFLVDVDLIERIEIVRGPSASLYGNSAFFGVINVVTREPVDVMPGEIAVSAGRYDAYSGRFSLGQRFGEKGSLLLSGSLSKSRGADLYFPLYDAPEHNHGVAEGLDGERIGSLFLKARHGDWMLQASYLDRVKERPTASFDSVFNDPAADDLVRDAAVTLSWAGELAPAWDGLFRAGWRYCLFDAAWPFLYPAGAAQPQRVIGHMKSEAEFVDGGARFTARGLDGHVLTFGTDVRHAYRLDLQSYYEGLPPLQDQRERQTDIGAYLQDEIELSEHVTLNAGLRYDRIEPYGDDRFSPRTALILSPFDTSTLKLIYGEAFRAPSTFERHQDDQVAIKANPDLKPETIRTYEIVWEQQVTDRLRLNLSLYRFEIDRLILQMPDPADGKLVYRNLDEARGMGGELEALMDLPGGARARASYAYSDAIEKTARQRLANSPDHLAKMQLFSPVVPRWLNAAIEGQYIGERLSVHREKVHDAMVVNLALLSRPTDRLDLAFHVYNVFDKAYSHPSGPEVAGGVVEQDGRFFRLKATYQF